MADNCRVDDCQKRLLLAEMEQLRAQVDDWKCSAPTIIANWLAQEYPDNANTNAFCAAIRSFSFSSTKHPSGAAMIDNMTETEWNEDRSDEKAIVGKSSPTPQDSQ